MINKASLIIYTLAHFAVDFSCFYILMGAFSNRIIDINIIALGFLLYNVLAFGSQMFIGYFADQYKVKPFILAGLGVLIVFAGVLSAALPWTALVLCAIGNAFFHIGGGIDSLVYAKGRSSRCGIFVSAGAVGVVLGTVAGRSGLTLAVPSLALVFSAFFICMVCIRENNEKDKNFRNPKSVSSYIPYHNLDLTTKLIIYLCLISIVIRSFVGSEIPITWKTNTALFILPGICAFAGKLTGGFLADRFGAGNTGVLSLIISVPLLTLFNNNIIWCSIGLVLFNMTMSITLWGIAAQLPEQPGFAFGLTTFALLTGNIPTFFYRFDGKQARLIIPVLIVCSAVCIFFAINNKRGEKYDDSGDNFVSKRLSV